MGWILRLRIPAAAVLAIGSGVAAWLHAFELAAWLAQGGLTLGLTASPDVAAAVRRVLESVRPRKALSATESGPGVSAPPDPSA